MYKAVYEDEEFEIHTKTDENGWVYVINIPDGQLYLDFHDGE